MMTNKAGQVRKGDDIDTDGLVQFLQTRVDFEIKHLEIRQYSGGYSNLTYQLTINEGICWVLRKPPGGLLIKSGHDMKREYKIISSLQHSFGKVPAPILFCENDEIIGTHFYVMSHIDGWILRSALDSSFLPSATAMGNIFDNFVSNFVDIHELDYKSIGLDDLGNPEQYPERQIDGWTKRYFHAKTDEISSVENLAKWLCNHIPLISRSSLIHNDYKYDNLILHPSSNDILAVLDWEMSTLGDPLMDLGSSLGYWVNRDDPDWLQAIQLSPSTLDGNPSREGLLHAYATKSGIDPGNGVFYYAYGMMKLAVIAQQIYTRYKRGQTNNPKFANLNKVVEACGAMGLRAIECKRLDGLY
ncbi:MAG: phosphotransferase family protein [Saprospiraceae bacterium]|nr:phosphotransferase family protein [Saprospiraceae bacterium]